MTEAVETNNVEAEANNEAYSEPKNEANEQREAESVSKAKEHGISVAEFERTKQALEKANKEAMERRHKLKAWEELNVDPDSVKSLLQEKEQAERRKKEEEGKYQELLAEMEEKTQAEIERTKQEYESTLQAMKSTVETHLVDKTIAEHLSSEGVKSPKLVSRYMKDYVKAVQDEDGQYATVVLDDNGEIRTKRGGAKFTVADFMEELKNSDEFASVFPAPKVSGTGVSSDASKPSKAESAGMQRSKMSLEQKIAYQSKHGMEAYMNLPR